MFSYVTGSNRFHFRLIVFYVYLLLINFRFELLSILLLLPLLCLNFKFYVNTSTRPIIVIISKQQEPLRYYFGNTFDERYYYFSVNSYRRFRSMAVTYKLHNENFFVLLIADHTVCIPAAKTGYKDSAVM
uniref:Uncharacterized protein n=1 Tax=Glossina austeni TaxID=7395 RepID=A0A1A9UL05_GLOAU